MIFVGTSPVWATDRVWIAQILATVVCVTKEPVVQICVLEVRVDFDTDSADPVHVGRQKWLHFLDDWRCVDLLSTDIRCGA